MPDMPGIRWSAISIATWSPRARSSRSSSSASAPRARAQDPEALAEAAAQVARDRREHRGLVVDDDDRRAALGTVRAWLVACRGCALGLGGHRDNERRTGSARSQGTPPPARGFASD